ncbi:inositol-tetrakisphosphate 1-kinase-like isoform X2 [Oreochromis aureus]|uniref:inositol-tetrakisphosphate 1-kinase-like isoform X2 n=1 Tax=Oreochromis aureus TaxID=47969 RepID=UPI00195363B7|nr:inositol-tetrakisphosphate 1-kinase-like isoform X2 [Oreochromis aureus]
MTHDCPHKRVRGLDTPEQKWHREGMNGSPVRARVRSLGCWGPDVRAQGGLLAQRQEVQEDEPGRVHTVLCIDLTQPLGPQGPFDIILHKLSDVIVEAEHDSQSQQLLDNFQSYVSAHPDTVLLDPLPAMAKLLDRFVSCRIMSQLNSSLRDWRICSPPCLEVHSGNDLSSIQQAVIRQGLTFPLICKTRVAHGSYSHEMCLLFSAASLADIHPPCVLQSFVNHGAVLYKVFVVGDKHCCVERPSIKNFPSGPCDRKTIFFNSQKVSKPESNSDLTSVDEHMVDPPCPSSDAVAALVKELRAQLGMALFGVDVIINIGTHALTVIDINIFPGYEGMPQFFSSLLSHIQSVLDKHAAAGSHTTGGSSEETVGVCHPRS